MLHRTLRATVFLLTVALLGCGEPYRDAATRYHAAAQEVLVAHHICDGPQDCQKKALLFWEGGRRDVPLIQEGGASLNLYDTSDESVIEAVAARLRAVQQTEDLPGVELTVYGGPHANKGQKLRAIFISRRANDGA